MSQDTPTSDPNALLVVLFPAVPSCSDLFREQRNVRVRPVPDPQNPLMGFGNWEQVDEWVWVQIGRPTIWEQDDSAFDCEPPRPESRATCSERDLFPGTGGTGDGTSRSKRQRRQRRSAVFHVALGAYSSASAHSSEHTFDLPRFARVTVGSSSRRST